MTAERRSRGARGVGKAALASGKGGEAGGGEDREAGRAGGHLGVARAEGDALGEVAGGEREGAGDEAARDLVRVKGER